MNRIYQTALGWYVQRYFRTPAGNVMPFGEAFGPYTTRKLARHAAEQLIARPFAANEYHLEQE
jgi:hypothetical protein